MEAAGAAACVPGCGESIVDSSGNGESIVGVNEISSSALGVHGDGDPIWASVSAPSAAAISVCPPPVCVPSMGSSVLSDGTAGAGGCDCDPEESGP